MEYTYYRESSDPVNCKNKSTNACYSSDLITSPYGIIAGSTTCTSLTVSLIFNCDRFSFPVMMENTGDEINYTVYIGSDSGGRKGGGSNNTVLIVVLVVVFSLIVVGVIIGIVIFRKKKNGNSEEKTKINNVSFM